MPKLKRLRIAVLVTLGAFASVAAECETVGTTQDMCTQEPADWTPLDRQDGEECLYAADCFSGMCMPAGGETALCSPRTDHTSSCAATMGPDFVAMVLPACVSGVALEACALTNPSAEACDTGTCCEFAEPCTRNEDCCSLSCADVDGDGQGACASIHDGGTCDGNILITDVTDPRPYCVPTDA